MSLFKATGIGMDCFLASAPLPLEGILVVYGLLFDDFFNNDVIFQPSVFTQVFFDGFPQ